MNPKKSKQHHKEYHITRAKQAYNEKKEKVNSLKNRPCVDCGNIFHHSAMDFDHTENNKVSSVAWLINNRSWQAVLDEIAKCELVCANCHRVRTYLRLHS